MSLQRERVPYFVDRAARELLGKIGEARGDSLVLGRSRLICVDTAGSRQHSPLGSQAKIAST